jgi:hypothetical protein
MSDSSALTTAKDLWMVRTFQNVISGPMSREKLCELILRGEFRLHDEICHANGYWFYLHERAEVARHLGIEVPISARSAGPEATLITKMDEDEITDPEIYAGPGGGGSSPERPRISVPSRQTIQVLRSLERPSYWRGVAGILLVATLLLVVLVLRLLHQ